MIYINILIDAMQRSHPSGSNLSKEFEHLLKIRSLEVSHETIL